MSAPDPLAGLRVLDFSRVVAGPFATRMLADLGADVVKVEPPEGDLTRLWGKKTAGLTGFYTQQNAGKRNICIDMKTPRARQLLLDMATKADIIVENYRPGVMERLGLAYDDFAAVNPRVIMLSISGFGQNGPASARAAFAPILHAESGLLGRQGRFDETTPSDPMLSIADTNASLHGLVAVLSALHLRESTGTGQHIDLAMLNSMTVTDDYAHHALDHEPIVRLGGVVWTTKDGDLLAAGNERAQWYQLSKAGFVEDGLEPGAALEEKIATRHRVLEEFYAGFDVRADLLAALDRANIAWAEVRQPEDVFDTDMAVDRRLSVAIDDRAGGQRRVVQSPYHFSNARSEVRSGAPFRGEHNAEVLADWLALDEVAVTALEDEHVLLAEERP
jgi:crotonobetainyl-CoA:carnitine CoA-transferase CaiB-like acyl-CoA transferase